MFFVVGAVISSMSVYVRRAVQGRMRDARHYMVVQVNDVYSGNIALGNLALEYNPYYLESVSYRSQDQTETRRLLGSTLPTASSGIAEIEYDNITRTRTFSNTAPPRNAR